MGRAEALASEESFPDTGDPELSGSVLDGALDSRGLERLQREVLPGFLARQRWFAGKGGAFRVHAVTPFASLPGHPNRLMLLEAVGAGEPQLYFLPLSLARDSDASRSDTPKGPEALAAVQDGARTGTLVDAAATGDFVRALAEAMRAGADLPAERGSLRFRSSEAFRALDLGEEVRAVGVEQSNVSVIIGQGAMLKVYRRLRAGEQPEVEVARFLTEVGGFANTPAFLGSAEYVPDDGEPIALAAAFAFVLNQGDAWGVVLDRLIDGLETAPLAAGEESDGGAATAARLPLDLAATLGRRTAELHAALATPTEDPAFAAEAVSAGDVGSWVDAAIVEAEGALEHLERSGPQLPDAAKAEVAALLAAREAVLQRLDAARGASAGLKTRIHGDYHLGQVLVAGDDVMIIDFEGEPQRDIEARREKSSPLRDVAGMLRSFDYAATAALDRLHARRGSLDPAVRARAVAWRDAATAAFLEAYWPLAAQAGLVPADSDARRRLLEVFLFQKAFYEIGYEAANRPSWIPIPVRGVLDLIAPQESPQ